MSVGPYPITVEGWPVAFMLDDQGTPKLPEGFVAPYLIIGGVTLEAANDA